MSRDLIFEIGTEELPASFIAPALRSLESQWTEAAAEARLSHGAVETHGTPRRLALLVRDVAERAADHEERAEGPAVKVAYDAEGKPTKAAEGFARKVGIPVDQLQRIETPQGERLFALIREEGKPARVILPELLSKLIAGIPFRKSMRWGTYEETFARPVRWIVAVLDGEVVPVKFADATSGGVTYGHRFLSPGEIPLTKCDDYLPKLREAKVLASIAERRERVVQEIERVAKEAGGRPVQDDELVDTITGLVEWPAGVLGSYDEDALDMPREVLVSEMREHQKYASLESLDGTLLPLFVAVANTPVKDVSVSRRGYERVLRARLADARFFFDEDRTKTLASRVTDLRRVTFQERLGSIHDKVDRIRHLVRHLAETTQKASVDDVERAATLCKADLTTGMVGEFPELQGVMGREYARHDGEKPEVALGIFEHYLPRGATDELPTGDVGAIVGISDRVDTLTGIFAIGKPPSGAADPFGLRRACLGVIRVVVDRGYRISLDTLVERALQHHFDFLAAQPAPEPKKDSKGRERKKPAQVTPEQAKAQVLEFFRGRLRALYSESYPVDVVEAVLDAGYDDLTDFHARLTALAAMVERPDFHTLAIAFGRASNIIEKQAKDLGPGEVDPSKLQEEPERGLFDAAGRAAKDVEHALSSGDYASALQTLAALRPAVDLFFDKVLVMAEDPAVRENRLRLVRSVQRLFAPIADFGKIQTK